MTIGLDKILLCCEALLASSSFMLVLMRFLCGWGGQQTKLFTNDRGKFNYRMMRGIAGLTSISVIVFKIVCNQTQKFFVRITRSEDWTRCRSQGRSQGNSLQFIKSLKVLMQSILIRLSGIRVHPGRLKSLCLHSYHTANTEESASAFAYCVQQVRCMICIQNVF